MHGRVGRARTTPARRCRTASTSCASRCAAAGARRRCARGCTVDTRAPRPTVLVGVADRWITGPVAGDVAFRVLVVSGSLPDAACRSCARTREPRAVVARFDARRRACARELGRPRRRRAGAARHLPDRRRRCATAPATSGARAPPADADEPVRGTPGRERAHAHRPAAGRPGARGRAGRTFAVDSRGRPFRWSMRRIGEQRAAREGEARVRRAAQAQGARRRRPASTSSTSRIGARPHERPVRRPGRQERRRSSSCSRSITWFGSRRARRRPRRRARTRSRAARRSPTRS